MRQIFLDTETTGLSAENGDRVIEIGCVELLHRKLTGNNLHFYLNPERDSHEDALRVHGITNEFLKDKPKFGEVVDQFLEYIEGAEVIIHNAPFDVGFLNKELELQGRKPFTSYVAGITDTLVMAKEMFPGKRNSLDALCDTSPAGQVEITAGFLKHKVRSNWKFLVENETDGYHPSFVHASIFEVAQSGIGSLRHGDAVVHIARRLIGALDLGREPLSNRQTGGVVSGFVDPQT